MELKETSMMLHPAGEQDNEDCEGEVDEENEQYDCFNPADLLENESSVQQQSIYRRVELLDKQ